MTTNKYSECTFRPAMKLNGASVRARVVVDRTTHCFSDTLVISTPPRLPGQHAKQAAMSRPPTIGRAQVKIRFSLASANIPHRHPIMDEAAFLAGRGNRGDGFSQRAHRGLYLGRCQRGFQRHIWGAAIDRDTTARLSFAKRGARALQRRSCQTPA
jgi:hypothetical protein